jgi:hypothetical protein
MTLHLSGKWKKFCKPTQFKKCWDRDGCRRAVQYANMPPPITDGRGNKFDNRCGSSRHSNTTFANTWSLIWNRLTQWIPESNRRIIKPKSVTVLFNTVPFVVESYRRKHEYRMSKCFEEYLGFPRIGKSVFILIHGIFWNVSYSLAWLVSKMVWRKMFGPMGIDVTWVGGKGGQMSLEYFLYLRIFLLATDLKRGK